MAGKTLLQVFVLVSCGSLTALGYRNSNGDNNDAIAAATRAACSDECSASLAQQARGSFGHEYSFQVERTFAGKKSSQQVIVSCQRELVLIGDWRCNNKTAPSRK